MRYLLTISLQLLIIFLPLNAIAAEKDIYALSLNELMKVTVKGATLTEKKLHEVPAQVTVYSQSEIRMLGIDSLEELMNLVPGFQSYRQGESSTQMGFSSRGRRIGTSGREILVLFNGMRLDNIWSGGMSVSTPKLNIFSFSKVEFIRGPGAAIYGSNAFLGVINIVSDITENIAQLKGGSHGLMSVKAQGIKQFHDKKLSGFFNYTKDSGQTYLAYNEFNQKKESIRDPYIGIEVNLKFGDEQLWFEFFHSNKQASDFYISDRINQDRNTSKIEYSNIYLAKRFSLNSNINSIFKIGYKTLQQRIAGQATAIGALSQISSPPSDEALFAKGFIKEEESWFQLDNNWLLDKGNALQFGLEYRHQVLLQANVQNNFDLGDLAQGNFPIRYYDDNSHYTSLSVLKSRDVFGVYSQYQSELFESIQITAGVRLDTFQSIGSHVSPRLGLVYPLSKEHSFKLLYGEAFRAPSNNELNSTNNLTVLGNPNLKPEVVSTWDMVYLYQNSNVTGNLGLFYSEIDDSIEQRVIDNIRQFSNFSKEEIQGVEFELGYQLQENIIIKSGVSHFFEKPDSAFRESENLAYIIFDYHFNKWQINFSGYYHSEKSRLIDIGQKQSDLPSYWLANAKFSYKFGEAWSSSFVIKNLFDSEFITPPQGSTAPEAIPNRGRDVYLSFIYEF